MPERKKKPNKPKSEKYDPPLKIDMSFEDLVKLTVTPKKKEEKKT